VNFRNPSDWIERLFALMYLKNPFIFCRQNVKSKEKNVKTFSLNKKWRQTFSYKITAYVALFFLIGYGYRAKLFLNDAKLHLEHKIVLRHAPKIIGWFYILVSNVRFQYIFHFDVFYEPALHRKKSLFRERIYYQLHVKKREREWQV